MHVSFMYKQSTLTCISPNRSMTHDMLHVDTALLHESVEGMQESMHRTCIITCISPNRSMIHDVLYVDT